MGLFSSVAKAVGSVASAVSGGGISGIIGAGLGYLGQQSANQTNVDIASANNQTSIELANTAYQRRVKDLIAAGLNPMLAYAQGGAQVPSLQQARVENSAESASRTGMGAMQSRLLAAQIDTQESQTALNSANAAKAAVEARSISATAGLSEYDLAKREFGRDEDFANHISKLERDRFENIVGQILSEQEYRGMNELNALAKKNGYANFATARKSVDFQREILDLYQSRLENPKLESYSNMFKSDFGKNIAPYLNSGEQATRIFKNVR